MHSSAKVLWSRWATATTPTCITKTATACATGSAPGCAGSETLPWRKFVRCACNTGRWRGRPLELGDTLGLTGCVAFLCCKLGQIPMVGPKIPLASRTFSCRTRLSAALLWSAPPQRRPPSPRDGTPRPWRKHTAPTDSIPTPAGRKGPTLARELPLQGVLAAHWQPRWTLMLRGA